MVLLLLLPLLVHRTIHHAINMLSGRYSDGNFTDVETGKGISTIGGLRPLKWALQLAEGNAFSDFPYKQPGVRLNALLSSQSPWNGQSRLNGMDITQLPVNGWPLVYSDGSKGNVVPLVSLGVVSPYGTNLVGSR